MSFFCVYPVFHRGDIVKSEKRGSGCIDGVVYGGGGGGGVTQVAEIQ